MDLNIDNCVTEQVAADDRRKKDTDINNFINL